MSSNQGKKVRIRKACDSCNFKRTKCDGNHPCGHCTRLKTECTYLRQEKRRGRASEKYPKQIKKRKTNDDVTENLLLKTKNNVFIASKRPESNLISHGMINGYPTIVKANSIPSNNLLVNAPVNFDLGTTRFPVLTEASEELRLLGMKYEVADELFKYYFDSQYQPAAKVFSILRRIPMLQSERKTQPNLLLCVLLNSAVQIDHRFFAGSNRDYACQSMYRMIQERLPSVKEQFTFDDFLCVVHLSFCMPWLSYPTDSEYWWKLGYSIAKHLRLNEINVNDSNDLIEEKIRGWWGLYIMDRLTALCFNLPIVITDQEADEFFLPCDETIWNETNQTIPIAYLDPSRKKGIRLDFVEHGIFGWSLNTCWIMGKYVQYRSCPDPNLKEHLKRSLIKSGNQSLQTILNYQKSIDMTALKGRSAAVDMLYAKYITLVLIYITENDDGTETIGDFEGTTSEMQYQRCGQYIETLEEILKMDEGLSRNPFLLSFFIFIVGVSLVSSLSDITSTDLSSINRINKYKYHAKVLIRFMEVILITFPSEFLRTLRIQLGLSLKDCDHVILLTDYIEVFKENNRKRRESFRAYSWGEGGRGIAV